MNQLKNKLLRLKRQDGYMTIEITLIFQVLFFSLLLILFIGIVLYQEVNLQSLAVKTSERGSVIYSSRVADMDAGVKTLSDFKYRDPYRNVPFMDGGSKEDYKGLLNAYVAKSLGKRDVVTGEIKNSGNYVTVEDYLIAKKIRVNIQSDYQMPADSIAKMFGKNGPFSVNTTAVSAVADSPDFVRNVDLATDIAKQSKIFGKVEEGYGKIKDAIKQVEEWLK